MSFWRHWYLRTELHTYQLHSLQIHHLPMLRRYLSHIFWSYPSKEIRFSGIFGIFLWKNGYFSLKNASLSLELSLMRLLYLLGYSIFNISTKSHKKWYITSLYLTKIVCFLLFQCFKGPPSGTPRGEGTLRVPNRKFDLEYLSWAIWQHLLKLARILKTFGETMVVISPPSSSVGIEPGIRVEHVGSVKIKQKLGILTKLLILTNLRILLLVDHKWIQIRLLSKLKTIISFKNYITFS